MALTAATDAQAAFQDFVAEDSRVKDLVEELLKATQPATTVERWWMTIVEAYDASAENLRCNRHAAKRGQPLRP